MSGIEIEAMQQVASSAEHPDPSGAPIGTGTVPPRPRARERLLTAIEREGAPSRIFVAVLLIAAVVWAANAGPFINLVGQSCAIFAIAALGQSILVGGAGQVAFSGGAFMAIGAFTAGILVKAGVDNFILVFVISAVAGWVVGIVAGLPGLRFRGLYLLLSSIALQYIVTSLTREYEASKAPGGLVVPPLKIGSLDLSAGSNMYWALIVILLAVFAAIAVVERTGVGLAWNALRESEVAASLAGVDVVRWKLYAFAASGAVTSMAGCLFAYWVGRADYQSFDLTLTITLVTMIFIGGVNSRVGAIFGAVAITALPYFLQSKVSAWALDAGLNFDWYLNNLSLVNAGLFSLIFLLIVLFEPQGLMGILTKIESWIRARFRTRSSAKEATA